MQRYGFASGLQCGFYGIFQSAAAGHFHAYDSYALNIVFADDCCKLISVVRAVKLVASNESDPIPNESVMEISICVSGTVSSDQQIRSF